MHVDIEELTDEQQKSVLKFLSLSILGLLVFIGSIVVVSYETSWIVGVSIIALFVSRKFMLKHIKQYKNEINTVDE
jgi:uncharacterized membrane protein (DUF485 family)